MAAPGTIPLAARKLGFNPIIRVIVAGDIRFPGQLGLQDGLYAALMSLPRAGYPPELGLVLLAPRHAHREIHFHSYFLHELIPISHSATVLDRIIDPAVPHDAVTAAHLHGDGFAEFQGGANQQLHLSAKVLHLPVEFPVAAPKGLEPVEFQLKLLNGLESHVGGAGVWFAMEHFPNQHRKGATMRRKGVTEYFDGQPVSKFAARDPAFRMTASVGTPGDESVVLGRGGVSVTQIAVRKNHYDLRVGRLAP